VYLGLRIYIYHSAAKTALLLDNTQLGPSQVHVSGAHNLDDIAGGKAAAAGEESGEDISQEDKPRSRIVAEYLAHGYTISDGAIQRAIALDNKHGISARFTSALAQFDSKYKATDNARAVDNKYGVTATASKGWAGMNSYFEKALGTPTGQKLRDFYVQGDKQVRDIHAEARRLADLKGGKATNETEKVGETGQTVCKCGADTGKCPCEPGHCACNNCDKSGDKSVNPEKTASSAV